MSHLSHTETRRYGVFVIKFFYLIVLSLPHLQGNSVRLTLCYYNAHGWDFLKEKGINWKKEVGLFY